MAKFGYKLMAEEHGPSDLGRNAVRAEQAGFAFAEISDHFSPWLEEQGHSPMAWLVLAAIANSTRRLGLMTGVTCPIMRYHPAIVAQMTATLALLSDNRFTLGLGAGERLNEHIVGQGWPGVAERHERLSEAIDIIQGLLKGELSNYEGKYFRLDNARLFDRPDVKPRVVMAAGGVKAAALAARKTEGLMATDPDAEIVQAFTSAGGAGPRYVEVPLCCAARKDEAVRTAHHYFRWALSGWPVMAELPNTRGFAAASQHVTPDMVAEAITCGPSAEDHLKAIGRYVEAGFDHIVLVQIGPDQDYFMDFFERELAPALRVGEPA